MPETDNDLVHRIFQAYYDARKNKRNTHSQLRFEIGHEARLIALDHAVRERRYQIRPSIAFIVEEPLQREGNHDDWKGLPRTKSLFHSPENCGLPIGNLTSQLFSNVYLNWFDHYVKSIPGVIHYGRYVDDLCGA